MRLSSPWELQSINGESLKNKTGLRQFRFALLGILLVVMSVFFINISWGFGCHMIPSPIISLIANNVTGTYGSSTSISATLTYTNNSCSPNQPAVGEPINFTLNGVSVGSVNTDANGVATLNNASLSGINASSYPTGVGANFAGDGGKDYGSVAASAALTVDRATPTVSVTNSPVVCNGSPQAANVTGSVSGSVTNVEYNGSTTVPTNAATYAITADFSPADPTNYNSLTGVSAGNFMISTVSVTGVSLNESTRTLTVGDPDQLTATVAPANATNKNVTWTSSDPTIASVDATGKVTAVGAGSATITVTTADGGLTATDAITANSATITTPSAPGIPQATIGSDLTSQVWTWTASTDTGSGVSHYDWQVDGGPNGTTTATTVTTNLAVGNWKFHIRAEDNAGNQSAARSALLSIFSSSLSQVTIDNSVPVVWVVIPNDVSNPILDLSPITTLSGDLLEADINTTLHLKTILPPTTITMDIPAGAVITGAASEWNKNIIPPVSVIPTLLPAAPSGFSNRIALAVLIGHVVAPLDITKGVRIFLGGACRKKVGYVSNNAFTEITSTCADDSQTIGDTLAAGEDCKIDSGSDLVIWTKHFTDFIAYTLVPSQNPPSGGGSSVSVGVGGGAAEYKITINGSASSTYITDTTLSIYATGAYTMEISNDPNFASSTWIPYATVMPWTLAPGVGQKTVYAKFQSIAGSSVGTAQASITLLAPSQSISTLSSSSSPQQTTSSRADLQATLNALNAKFQALFVQAGGGQSFPSVSVSLVFMKFMRDLQFYDIGNDVQMLQQFLNGKGFLVSQTGSGSPGNETTLFGPHTLSALIAFQKSVNIVPAQGYFGPITREYVNAHD